MRDGVTSLIERTKDQPDSERRFTSMCIHALHLARLTLGSQPAFGSDKLMETVSDVGANFIRASGRRSDNGRLGVVNGLVTCASGAMLDGISPDKSLTELAGKALLDLEMARAIFAYFNHDQADIVRLEETIETVKSNIPLHIMEYIETEAGKAIQDATTILTQDN